MHHAATGVSSNWFLLVVLLSLCLLQLIPILTASLQVHI